MAVIEVGLGGIRDATNVFDSRNLQLAVITAIGLEHQKALGELTSPTYVCNQTPLQAVFCGAGFGSAHGKPIGYLSPALVGVPSTQGSSSQEKVVCEGSSLKEIAAAKVGICKSGRPVVVGPQPEAEALQTIKEEVAATGSPAVHASQVRCSRPLVWGDSQSGLRSFLRRSHHGNHAFRATYKPQRFSRIL